MKIDPETEISKIIDELLFPYENRNVKSILSKNICYTRGALRSSYFSDNLR